MHCNCLSHIACSAAVHTRHTSLVKARSHLSLSCLHCVQGLADTFIILGMAFDSPEAKQLNKDIFECIYYNALVTSCALAKVDGERSYPCI